MARRGLAKTSRKMAGKRAQDVRLADFLGGEASIFPMASMPTKFSLKLENCFVTDTSGVAKMPGYEKVNNFTLNHKIYSGCEFVKRDGTKIILVAGVGSIYKIVAGIAYELKDGLDTTAKVNFTTFNDYCVITNGVDLPMKYDGTTITLLGGSPPATAFKSVVFKNRLWMLERTNKMLSTHSALNALEDFTSPDNAGYIDFAYVLTQGDELLDMVAYIDMLIFFFRHHIVIYNGKDPTSGGDFAVVQVIEGCGVIDSGLVQALGTDLSFLYDSGVKNLRQVVTTGNLNVGDMSVMIDPTLLPEITAAASLGGPFAVGHYARLGWYLILIGEKIWVYSYKRKAWAEMVGAQVYGMFGSADGKLYMCGDGYLYEYHKGYDFNGREPFMLWKLGWLSPTRNGEKIYPKLIELVSAPGSGGATVYMRSVYDMGLVEPMNTTSFVTTEAPTLMDRPVPDIWENCFMMDRANYEAIRLPLFGGGRSMSLEFSNTSALGPIEFNDIIIQMEVGGN